MTTDWLEDFDPQTLDPQFNEECTVCGADLGPSSEFPWHLEDEDCRAIRQPMSRRDIDPLDAARGVFNGVALSVILWALIIVIIYYGWHV